MKKKFNYQGRDYGLRKCYVTMKFTILFMFISILQLRAEVKSQEVLFNLKMSNVSLIEVLKSIESQSDYTCLYSYEEVSKVTNLDLDFKNATVQAILEKCLKGTKLQYRIVDQTIVIRNTKVVPQTQKVDKKTIKGRVVDLEKIPLPGVTVIIKGTTLGCATDTAGRFQLVLPDIKDIVLEVSFIGMETKVIKLKDIKDKEILDGKKELDIVLVEQAESLDDVVVTGYANVRKESYTGTSVRIEGKELMKVANRNIISALQVFDPSFRIMENNLMGSNPNAIPEFYVRGQSGVGVRELDVADVSEAKLKNNPNLPIFILDGFDVSAEKIYDMDPTRIHSITILKDAAATAIYGSRASNGVIVVETKAPKAGKLNVNYNFVGSLTAPDLSSYDYFDAREKLAAEVAAGYYKLKEDGSNIRQVYTNYMKKLNAINKGVDTYWLSQPLRTGFNHKHSVYVDGGNDAVRYGFELRYDNENGVMKKSYRNRVGAGFYIDYRLKDLQIRNHVTYDRVSARNSPFGSFGDFVKQLPYNEMKDETGHYTPELPLYGNGTSLVNPMYEGAETKNFSKNYYEEFTNNFSLDWYITEAFRFKGQIALTKRIDGSKNFLDPKSGTFNDAKEYNGEKKGSLAVSDGNQFRWTTNWLLMYNQIFEHHYLTGTLGLNTTESVISGTSAFYRGFPSGNLSSIMYAQEQVGKTNETDNHTRLFGAFLTMNYSYKDIYLFDASCRLDGSSEFGADRKWAPFWSLGTGLNMHRYPFLTDNPWISQLKLTLTYGQTGKVNFQPYAAKDIYEIYDKNWYITGMGVQLMALGNTSLGWEVKNSTNVGVEFTLKEGLFYLKGTYYYEKTKDMITQIDIPSSFGFTQYYDNLGEVENRGYEFQLRSDILNKKDWFVSVFANLSHNKNEILKVSNSLSNYNNKVNDYYEEYNRSEFESADEKYAKPFLKYEEGGTLTSIFGMKSLGIDPASGQEVYVRRDGTITYDWEANEQQIIGDTEPAAKGSFGFNFVWKSLSVYASFMYEFGGERYNNTYPTHIESVDLWKYNADKRVFSDRWMHIGDKTPLKDIKDRSAIARPTSRFVQKYNTLDFNSLSIAWTFDNDWVRKLGLNVLKLQFNTTGLAHFSTVKQERGTSYPYARVYDLSLNISF
ncbi:SusC/RagA family TonB-linked outer membrane protein [Gabonibacter chumensis]|uniref:SusC/RagA family TonB-linked outer membrane protein n=1 Tax=Gabonibacter chumensis TaxID=2972474 RepID=UPI0025743943|nr:SusC/RagA family TonB-linked outer membrane protein [Gabonibacter chumensis]MCR9013215.1 SusC/RagA family TonB-linked outer membrane protein [Gabonibacter chumensis]